MALSDKPDPMAPVRTQQPAETSPLRAVTIATDDFDRTRRFYCGVLGMVAERAPLDGADAAALAAHWGLDAAPSHVMVLRQPGASGAAIVRAVLTPSSHPLARPAYDSRFVGPLGFGFPIRDLGAREQVANAFGFVASAGIRRMDFPRADGSTYNVGEIHFLAPDDIMVLGVDRGEMAPVGPLDEALSIGGVAYASVLVSDMAVFAAFLEDVLGLERRRRMSFQSPGPAGGMRGLDAGETIAFEQWFSHGAATGYLVVMQRLEGERTPAATGFAGRGVAMWTFETEALDAAVARFHSAGGAATVRTLASPGFGRRRSAILTTPDGLPVELIEAPPP